MLSGSWQLGENIALLNDWLCYDMIMTYGLCVMQHVCHGSVIKVTMHQMNATNILCT